MMIMMSSYKMGRESGLAMQDYIVEAAAREFGVDAKRVRVWCSQKEQLVRRKKKKETGWSRPSRKFNKGRPQFEAGPFRSQGINLAEGNRGPGLYSMKYGTYMCTSTVKIDIYFKTHCTQMQSCSISVQTN